MNVEGFKNRLLGEKYYSGELGDFWYDPAQFSVIENDFLDLIQYIGQHSKSIEVPAGVTNMVRTFTGHNELESIKLPESLERIGPSVFTGCKSLKCIELAARITKLSNYCFADCSSLKTIDIKNNVNSIGQGCFSGCSALVSTLTFPFFYN